MLLKEKKRIIFNVVSLSVIILKLPLWPEYKGLVLISHRCKCKPVPDNSFQPPAETSDSTATKDGVNRARGHSCREIDGGAEDRTSTNGGEGWGASVTSDSGTLSVRSGKHTDPKQHSWKRRRFHARVNIHSFRNGWNKEQKRSRWGQWGDWIEKSHCSFIAWFIFGWSGKN